VSPEAVSHATSLSESWLGAKLVDIIHQFQLRGGQLLNPVNDISKKPGRSRTEKSLLHLRSRQGIVCLCRQRPGLP
jgi:hypothetical protein